MLKLQQSLRTCTQLEVTDLPDFESLREHQKRAAEGDVSPVDTESPRINNNNNNKRIDIYNSGKNGGSIQRGSFQTLRRMQGIVNVISEELFDVPLHYTQEKLSQVRCIFYDSAIPLSNPYLVVHQAIRELCMLQPY